MPGAKAERVVRWKHRPRLQGRNRSIVRHVLSGWLSFRVLASSRRTVISCVSGLSLNFSLIHTLSPLSPSLPVAPSIFPVLYIHIYYLYKCNIWYISRDPIDHWCLGPLKLIAPCNFLIAILCFPHSSSMYQRSNGGGLQYSTSLPHYFTSSPEINQQQTNNIITSVAGNQMWSTGKLMTILHFCLISIHFTSCNSRPFEIHSEHKQFSLVFSPLQ